MRITEETLFNLLAGAFGGAMAIITGNTEFWPYWGVTLLIAIPLLGLYKYLKKKNKENIK